MPPNSLLSLLLLLCFAGAKGSRMVVPLEYVARRLVVALPFTQRDAPALLQNLGRWQAEGHPCPMLAGLEARHYVDFVVRGGEAPSPHFAREPRRTFRRRSGFPAPPVGPLSLATRVAWRLLAETGRTWARPPAHLLHAQPSRRRHASGPGPAPPVCPPTHAPSSSPPPPVLV